MNTEQMLILAMKRLLQTHSINHITTAMILDESGLSRATFYRYFPDKYMLMIAVLAYELDHNLKKNAQCYSDIMTNLFSILRKNRTYFEKLCKQNPPNDFFNAFYRYSMQAIPQRMERANRPLTEADNNLLVFYVAGCSRLVENWIKNGMNDNPAQLIEFLIDITPERFLSD